MLIGLQEDYSAWLEVMQEDLIVYATAGLLQAVEPPGGSGQDS
jgi:hypothetical protein